MVSPVKAAVDSEGVGCEVVALAEVVREVKAPYPSFIAFERIWPSAGTHFGKSLVDFSESLTFLLAGV